MYVVAKFGNASLGSDNRINRTADSIAATVEHSHEIAVVTSTMGPTADGLLDEIGFGAGGRGHAEVISMGEWTSVRMFKAVLAARGVNALFVEPGTDKWPVITNDLGEVDIEVTRERATKLAAELGGAIPVITGFLAQSHDGKITTLGRGGPDTSTVMLGNYMDTDETIIVTDVENVITDNPCVIKGARNAGRITADELRDLSFRGTEVVVPSTLSYRSTALGVCIIHYQHGNLLTGGTPIEGEFHNLIDIQEEPLACLTVAGRAIRNRPGILTDLSAALREGDINVGSVASGMDSVAFYVPGNGSDRAETVLHDRVAADDALSSVTVEDNITVVRVTGGELPNRPGAILGIVEPLSETGINIHGAITPATSVTIFVAWDSREGTLGITRDEL